MYYNIDVVKELGDLQTYGEYEGQLLAEITNLDIAVTMMEEVVIKLPRPSDCIQFEFMVQLLYNVKRYLPTKEELHQKVKFIMSRHYEEDIVLIDLMIDKIYESELTE